MKKNMSSLVILLFVMVGFFFFLNNQKVYAADANYQPIKMDEGKTEKIGKYYFSQINYKIYISNSINGIYIMSPIEGYFFTNEKEAYYIKNDQAICKYIFDKKKEVEVYNLESLNPEDEECFYWQISAYYSGNFFITRAYDDYTTYRYNIKSKKLTTAVDGLAIEEVSKDGKYVIMYDAFIQDVSPRGVYLYQLRLNGVKKIKKLTSAGCFATFIGNDVYYDVYPNATGDGIIYLMNKAIFYKYNIKSDKKTQLGTFQANDLNAFIYFFDANKEQCLYSLDNQNYIYNYNTKRSKKTNKYKL